MKKFRIIAVMLIITGFCIAQSPVGTWKTIDDETGKAKSHVQIYESGGKLYGKIVKLLIKPENDKCVKCKGAMYNKPLIGLSIVNGLKKSGSEWTGGTITDPKTGKTYKCTITLNGKDKLNVRGYIGISLIGRNQTWERVE